MAGRRAGIALVAAAALAGCGGSGKPTPALTDAQARTLVAQLETARRAVAARDVTGTEAAVASFRRTVGRLERGGDLSAATARALRIGAARLLSRVRSDNPVQTPTPVVTAPQTVTVPAPAPKIPPGQAKKKAKHEKKPKKHGKGKGD